MNSPSSRRIQYDGLAQTGVLSYKTETQETQRQTRKQAKKGGAATEERPGQAEGDRQGD